MNIKELKIELRRRAEAKRKALPPDERFIKTKRINHLLIHRISEVLESRAKSGRRPTLFTYMPIKSEIDITPVMEACWSKQYRVLIPKVQPEQRLKLFEVRSHADFEPGTWGILEPVSDAPQLLDIKQIDAVLVPGLAFDVRLGRLGYGGGYYDRFMQQFIRNRYPKPYMIAGAFDLQVIKEVPMGLFDFRLDELITEERTIRAAKIVK
ncbi:5-formyltetrahydrofolate cyclo-ligase [Paenibacillus xerothermodurans]|uniref:5-formyltetrahydrofolate cyclo-ligase n=1 Tax=Paenibacillus xerothermodurans TaxID=1977292 RepID=A0A2W1NB03_PAEXE|nr:5-formyltetrahydrofolate cyclo-ligase [Paenibacillus xerothermodurans]PZE20830.1 5-formyltetrahydrofolate cyclo-ligase [Paenibacillus xerothermodurans]